MNARFANKRFVYSTTTLILTLVAMLALLLLFGCGEPPERNVTQAPQINWMHEGPIAYYFPNPNLVVIQYNGATAHIPRQYNNGQDGWIEWEWEEDGDIDIEVAGRDYDLDSPYDFDWNEDWGDDYYQDAGDGWAWVMVGGMLVKKKKSKLGKKYHAAPKGYHYTRVKATKGGALVQGTKTKNGVTEKVSVVKTKKGVITTKQVTDAKGNKVKTSEFVDNKGNVTKTVTGKTASGTTVQAKTTSTKTKSWLTGKTKTKTRTKFKVKKAKSSKKR